MTGPLRVGVIGANPNRSWAKDSHLPALRSLENVQLAAVATTSRASADAAAAAFGVRAAYHDPFALITASDIDIVSVCVRVPYHRYLVLAALAAEKHLYCEWPLGRDRGEAARTSPPKSQSGGDVRAAEVRVRPVLGVPEIADGDPLGDLIAQSAEELADGDVVVISQKVVSKAEGRTRRLSSVIRLRRKRPTCR